MVEMLVVRYRSEAHVRRPDEINVVVDYMSTKRGAVEVDSSLQGISAHYLRRADVKIKEKISLLLTNNTLTYYSTCNMYICTFKRKMENVCT